MKIVSFTLGLALASCLMGCSSKPVALGPVGPNPIGTEDLSNDGQLEVFSEMSGHTEGNNPTWYQHTGYYLYNQQGQRLKYVDNKRGHYEQPPQMINLPPGDYVVRAKAKHYLWVTVPVTITAGKLTEVHLDSTWRPAPDTPANEIVSAPAGYPVGWSVAATR